MWDSRYIPSIECSGDHPDSQSCPYGGTATPESPPLPSPNQPNEGKRGSKTRDIFTFHKHSWLEHASGMPIPIRLGLWATFQVSIVLVWITASCIKGTNVDNLRNFINLCFIDNSQTIKTKSSSIFHDIMRTDISEYLAFLYWRCMHVLVLVFVTTVEGCVFFCLVCVLLHICVAFCAVLNYEVKQSAKMKWDAVITGSLTSKHCFLTIYAFHILTINMMI